MHIATHCHLPALLPDCLHAVQPPAFLVLHEPLSPRRLRLRLMALLELGKWHSAAHRTATAKRSLDCAVALAFAHATGAAPDRSAEPADAASLPTEQGWLSLHESCRGTAMDCLLHALALEVAAGASQEVRCRASALVRALG